MQAKKPSLQKKTPPARHRSRRTPGWIGVIDSGLGGLSIWREIVRLLPHEDILYVADQAHVPYGDRSLEEVRRFAESIARSLARRRVRLLVIASNTISAAALRPLRRTMPRVTFVGMEPAIKPAVQSSESGVVGVLATRATFQGELFADLVRRFAGPVRVIPQACQGLVEAVEAGDLESKKTESLVRRYVDPLLEAGADRLVLGCTHYPFLLPLIERIARGRATIIDPAPAVARQTARVLREIGLDVEVRPNLDGKKRRPGGRHLFLTSGDKAAFSRALRRLLGDDSGAITISSFRWRSGIPVLRSTPIREPSRPSKKNKRNDRHGDAR